MIITKSYRYEMSHRVIGAYTDRCASNIHGHSYNLEIRFMSNTPDSAGMVLDFGLLKKYFAPFVDSFDHSHMIYPCADTVDELEYIKHHNKRWITAPFSSTAEMQAMMFATYGTRVVKKLKQMDLIRDEVFVHSATVHETRTGNATFNFEDNNGNFPSISIESLRFSEGIQKEWSSDFTEFYNCQN